MTTTVQLLRAVGLVVYRRCTNQVDASRHAACQWQGGIGFRGLHLAVFQVLPNLLLIWEPSRIGLSLVSCRPQVCSFRCLLWHFFPFPYATGEPA